MANLIRSKGVRPIAVTTARRTATLPDVPTMIEAGVPDFVVTQWLGSATAAHTPAVILDRLQREIAAALRHPEVSARLSADGTEVVASSRQEFAAHMRSERNKWLKVIQQTGISAK